MTRIDRRGLFTSGAAAALLAASGISAAASPRQGGRLRLAVARDDGTFEAVMRAAVFDTLTEIGPDGVLRGELVSDWHGAEGGRDWRFELRADARFHDGAPVRPGDVIASLAALDAEITAERGRTLRIRLPAPDPQLPFRLAAPELVVRPAEDQHGQIGSGLYRLRRLRPGRDFLAERVAPHYKDGRAGWFDAVEVAVIPDPAVRAEALRDGFVDVASLPQPAALAGRPELIFRPSIDDMALAARQGVGVPPVIGSRGPLDDGRIAERWWFAT